MKYKKHHSLHGCLDEALRLDSTTRIYFARQMTALISQIVTRRIKWQVEKTFSFKYDTVKMYE